LRSIPRQSERDVHTSRKIGVAASYLALSKTRVGGDHVSRADAPPTVVSDAIATIKPVSVTRRRKLLA
jgi:hypothetical protein